MIDHTNTMRITCPYCGHEVFSSCDKPNAGLLECSKCGGEYGFQRDILIFYTTFKREADE